MTKVGFMEAGLKCLLVNLRFMPDLADSSIWVLCLCLSLPWVPLVLPPTLLILENRAIVAGRKELASSHETWTFYISPSSSHTVHPPPQSASSCHSSHLFSTPCSQHPGSPHLDTLPQPDSAHPADLAPNVPYSEPSSIIPPCHQFNCVCSQYSLS